jgi:hypothetical protein
VPGAAAPDVIDLRLVLPDAAAVRAALEPLARAGFVPAGDGTGRLAGCDPGRLCTVQLETA